MIYEINQPPFTLKFAEMSKSELRDYGRWFQGIADQRVGILGRAVCDAPGYKNWRATFHPDSLTALGQWFAAQVSMRPRTAQEVGELEGERSLPISVPKDELSNTTFSLAFDIGIYFARTLERQHPQLQWKQFLNNKRFADYGQPVLVGFGPVPLNPVRVAINIAYGIAAGKHSGSRLIEVYDNWEKKVENLAH